ncbi:hypothetical protein [Flavobacterium frigoris]|uniref:hypothetical protein n=1 Tax=Flavobacterium frigoris TaxID=229204 RepID=UPI0002FEB8A2|nr:hypothetical protein [Flavobacterium frigoris]
MSKPLKWYLRRHSLLYKIRFKLVSKKSTFAEMEDFCYNSINSKNEIPSIYYEINQSIFTDGNEVLTDLKKAIKIAKWLRNNIKGGPGLGNSSAIALQKMINGEGGVCSDFAQVYNNFCVINDLKVKEWGLKIITDNPQTLGGHSFNAIYSKELQKWIIIDVAKCICFYHSNPRLPLSVSDLTALKKQNKEIKYFEFNKEIPADPKRIRELYLAMNSFPFLITNYRNKTCDYFLTKLHFLPVSIIHGILFLSGKSYSFEFPTHDANNNIERPVIIFKPRRNPTKILEEIAK